MDEPDPKRIRSRTADFRWYFAHNVLHADDPPHRLALGIAIGVFVTFLPIVGGHMLLVFGLAWLLRANKLVGTPIVWLMNPATAIPIFYACYVVGVWLLNCENVGQAWWAQLADPPAGSWEATKFYWTQLLDVALPLTVGCFVLGFVAAIPAYLVTFQMIRRHRMRRWGQATPPDPGHDATTRVVSPQAQRGSV